MIPISFLVGAGIEFFMIQTGFYGIVTRKEAERRLERAQEEENRQRRLAQLKAQQAFTKEAQ